MNPLSHILKGEHPGFAWGMRREWFKKIGFFDQSILGGGDHLSFLGWKKIQPPDETDIILKPYRRVFKHFLELEAPRITNLKACNAYHLYHGKSRNRMYIPRNDIIKDYDDIDELIIVNSDGIYEWREPELFNPKVLEYFKKRNDDDI
jgi:hypothetical protein